MICLLKETKSTQILLMFLDQVVETASNLSWRLQVASFSCEDLSFSCCILFMTIGLYVRACVYVRLRKTVKHTYFSDLVGAE